MFPILTPGRRLASIPVFLPSNRVTSGDDVIVMTRLQFSCTLLSFHVNAPADTTVTDLRVGSLSLLMHPAPAAVFATPPTDTPPTKDDVSAFAEAVDILAKCLNPPRDLINEAERSAGVAKSRCLPMFNHLIHAGMEFRASFSARNDGDIHSFIIVES
ncbi:MAG: hypothetical protein QM519_02350 [Bacteroidia bacterium]|nr:hypothetical protein [Bacteroidia bacterium]